MKYIISILFFVTILSAEDIILELRGVPKQGSLVSGYVVPEESRIYYQNIEIKTVNGDFFLGLEEDCDINQSLTIISAKGNELLVEFNINVNNYPSEVIEGISRKYTSKPEDRLLQKRLEVESSIYNYFLDYDSYGDPSLTLQYIRPVEGGRISSPFGIRRIINNVKQRPHSGLDIAVPLGTPVHAAGKGIVLAADHFFYQGKFVMLDHGYGLKTVYMHLDSLSVKPGELVDRGDQIGTVGSTGRSSGPHLHWGVYWKGIKLDPASFYEVDRPFFVFKSKR